jgi:hypothetical protein
MAEIKDVYSLEFNSGSFQSEVNSAISKVEELNNAMESGADVSEQLAEAQNELVSVLTKETKGIENLNAKRNVLVNTQKTLNKETQTGTVVSKQLAATNTQLAAETAKATATQRGFVGSLVQGARTINSVKRTVGALTGAFRLLSAAVPFGLILSFAPQVISFFTGLFKGTDKAAEAMEKLKDKTLGYGERLVIVQGELKRLEDVEAKRGYLTEKEKEKRAELVKEYEKASDEIVKIEENRIERLSELENRLAQLKIKLLGDSVAAANEQYKLDEKNAAKAADNRIKEIRKESKQLFVLLKSAQAIYEATSSSAANIRAKQIQSQLNALFQEEILVIKEQNDAILVAEQDKQKKINDLVEKSNKAKAAADKVFTDEELSETKRRLDEITKETELFIEEQNRIYKAYLAEQKRLAEAYKNEVSLKNYEDELKALADNLKTASDYRQNNRETELQLNLLALEKERNANLFSARNELADNELFNKEAENINKEFDKRRAELEKETNAKILADRILFLEQLRDKTAQADPLAASELNKQIAQLKTQLEEAQKPINDTADAVKKVNKQLKETIYAAAEFTQIASDAVFSVLNSQVQAYIGQLDRAVDKSQNALNEIRQNSEQFNARQLELEKERLDKLQAEREKAVEREKTIAQVQIAINTALTIAKAATEGVGIGSAFTIAAALASLIAGFASARAVAGNAFFHGVEYLERGNNPKGRDTIPARLHEGERVITAADNSKYWDALSAVHNHKIPADVLNGFVNGYQSNGLKGAFDMFSDRVNLSKELGSKGIFVNVATDNRELKNELEQIKQVLSELPKYMPKTTVTANANGIFKIVEQRIKRANFSSDRAK